MKKENKNYYYKQVRPIIGVTFDKVVNKMEWNKNTAKFESVKKDIQAEIDIYKGMDLETMIKKNIMPNSEKKGEYIDTTLFENINPYDLNNALNTDVEIENITENKKEQDEQNKKSDIKNFNKNEISDK